MFAARPSFVSTLHQPIALICGQLLSQRQFHLPRRSLYTGEGALILRTQPATRLTFHGPQSSGTQAPHTLSSHQLQLPARPRHRLPPSLSLCLAVIPPPANQSTAGQARSKWGRKQRTLLRGRSQRITAGSQPRPTLSSFFLRLWEPPRSYSVLSRQAHRKRRYVGRRPSPQPLT